MAVAETAPDHVMVAGPRDRVLWLLRALHVTTDGARRTALAKRLVHIIWDAVLDDDPIYGIAPTLRDLRPLLAALREDGEDGLASEFEEVLEGGMLPDEQPPPLLHELVFEAMAPGVDEARSAPPATSGLTRSRARSMLASDDPIEREAARRALRTDIPVLAAGGRLAPGLIGIEIAPVPRTACDPATGLSVTEPWLLDASFRQGIMDGREAALQLLARIGIDAAIIDGLKTLRIRVLGAPPKPDENVDPVLEGRSGALAIALTLIQMAAEVDGIALGPIPFVASGVFRDSVSGVLAPLDPNAGRDEPAESAHAKLEAVRDDGLRRTLMGAMQPDVAAGPSDVIHCTDLLDAARATWGDRWLALQRAHLRGGLPQQCVQLASGAGDGIVIRTHAGMPLDVATEKALKIERAYNTGSRAEVVLGPAQSGKTRIARTVGLALEARGWGIWWFRRPDLAQLEGLRDVAIRVRAASIEPRLLLIFDDLLARREEEDLDALVQALEDVDVRVLVLARTERTAEANWKTDRHPPHRAISGGADVPIFANAVVGSSPALAAAEPDVAAASSLARGDLGILVELLCAAADGIALPRDHAFAAIAERRLSGLAGSASALDGVRELAAVSLLDGTLPEPRGLSDAQLLDLGAARDAVGTGWKFDSPSLALAMLAATDDHGIAGLAVRHARALLAQAQDGERQTISLLLGARRQGVLADLAATLRPELAAWLEDASPRALAALIELQELPAGIHSAAIHALGERIASPRRLFGVSELARCLRTLRPHLRSLDEDDLVERIEESIRETLRRTVDRDTRATLVHRVALMTAMADALPLGRKINEEYFDDLVGQVDPNRAEDYRAALDAVEALGFLPKLAIVVDGEAIAHYTGSGGAGDGAALLATISSRLDALREEPTESTDAGVVFGWFALMTRLEGSTDWNDRMQVVNAFAPGGGSLLSRAVQETSTAQVAIALNHWRKHEHSSAHRTLHYIRISEQITAKLRQAATLGQFAELLNAVFRTHAATAHAAITVDDQPNDDLIERCRSLAWKRRDPKGVGMVLTIAGQIDEMYGGTRGFALTLADALENGRSELTSRFVERMLAEDERATVLAHLARALAQIGWPHLRRIEAPAVEHIHRAIRTTTRAAGPRLALMLAEDDALGGSLLQALATKLELPPEGVAIPPSHVLVQRMVRTEEPSALAAYHELAGGLDDASGAICKAAAWVLRDDRYKRRTQVVKRFVDDSRVERVALASRELGRTMSRAGIPNATAGLLAALDGAGWSWHEALQQGLRREGWATQGLDVLRSMDPTRAAAAAQLIAQDARTGALLWRQLDANPLGGMQTLYALEQASRGTGRAMLAELSGGSTRRWRQLELQLRYIPAALEQAQTYYVAARLGWIPPARERSWLWERRWQQQVGHLRGPRTIVAMLKWLATWPDHSALLDLVERVRWPAVARRINRGLGPDLEQLPELLGAMQTLRRMDLVLSLPEELSAEGLDRLSTDPLARLTRGLASVAALSPLVRDAAQRRLGHMARARTVLAPEAHFGAMGRLAHALRASGTASVATPVAPLRGRRPDVLTAAWGVTWMADSSWRSQILDEASAALAERQPRTPWATGAMELVGNALGWTRTHDTSRVWDASAAMLRDVLSLASGDESLRLRLDVHGEPADVAYDQLRDPAFALEPDALSAAELIESLRARAAALA